MIDSRCPHTWAAALTVAVLAGLPLSAEAVEITTQADKSLLVTGRTYTAAVDAGGPVRQRAVPLRVREVLPVAAGAGREAGIAIQVPGRVRGAGRAGRVDLRRVAGRRRSEGRRDAEVYSHWGSDTPDKIMAGLAKLESQQAGAGMWQRGAERIRVGAPQPQDSTYTRWAGRDDNNLLDSYPLNVRMADYLRGIETERP